MSSKADEALLRASFRNLLSVYGNWLERRKTHDAPAAAGLCEAYSMVVIRLEHRFYQAIQAIQRKSRRLDLESLSEELLRPVARTINRILAEHKKLDITMSIDESSSNTWKIVLRKGLRQAWLKVYEDATTIGKTSRTYRLARGPVSCSTFPERHSLISSESNIGLLADEIGRLLLWSLTPKLDIKRLRSPSSARRKSRP